MSPKPPKAPDASITSSLQPNPSSITNNPSWRPARRAQPSRSYTPPLDASNYPTGEKSLSGISLRAFLIGTGLGISIATTVALAPHPLWRIPFFLSALCLFHFLEYFVTATYNTRHASISAFLLSSNGWAYNVAHGSAVAECLLSHLFGPRNGYPSLSTSASVYGVKWQVILGILLMICGQTVRTLAMKQAGTNFNHTVQVERKEGHVLVQHGVYAVLRHPSYFGFFWWGMGTQLVLGNVVCFVGYAAVLWNFFNSRIKREEEFLVCFFGDEYVEYRKRTWIGIPGIF